MLFARFLSTTARPMFPVKSALLDVLPASSLQQIKKAAIKQIEAQRMLRKTKFKPPTLPRTAVNLYVSERFNDPDVSQRKASDKVAHILRDLSKEFKNLSDHEKDVYLRKRQQDIARFERQFSDWHRSFISNSEVTEFMKQEADKLREKYVRLNYLQG